ncbi:MAG: flippase-like domain-containing protein [Bacteroidales bacterium]|nr:flippase-like domain-containing protein [Bacteroidales bacterium]
MRRNNKKERKRFSWFFLLRLTGIVIFIIVILNVDLHAIWQNIKKVNPGYLALALLFQIVLLIVKGIRWHILNDGRRNKNAFFQSMGEFLESYAIGVITPGRLGELLKAGYQKKKENIIGSGIRVLAERGLDVGFFVFVAGSAIMWGNLINIESVWGIVIIITGILITGIAVLLISSRVIIDWIEKLSKKISITWKKRKATDTVFILILSLISNISAFISCYLLVIGIKIKMTLLVASGGVAIAGLLNMLPITVMGLGTRELTFLYVFDEFQEAQILALSGLIFLVAQIGGGIFSLLLGQLFLFINKKQAKHSN